MSLTRQIVRVQARRFILEILNSCEYKDVKSAILVSDLRDKFLEFYSQDEESIDFFYNYFEKEYRGGEKVFDNDMQWEITFCNLQHAGFVDNTTWGVKKITELGQKFLLSFSGNTHIEIDFFNNKNVYKWLQENAKDQWDISKLNPNRENEVNNIEDPDEFIATTIEEAKKDSYNSEDATKDMLKATISKLGDNDSKVNKGNKIENLVQEVFKKMGYFCIRTGATNSFKLKDGSGDGGIDMLVSKDQFGLNQIPVQVKGQLNQVSTDKIQAFVGAITGINKKDGIFVATATFSEDAKREALKQNIALIDIDKLVDLMMKHGLGITSTSIVIYNKDSDFFDSL